MKEAKVRERVENFYFPFCDGKIAMSQQRKSLKYKPEKRSQESFRRRQLLLSLGNQLHCLLFVISHGLVREFDQNHLKKQTRKIFGIW